MTSLQCPECSLENAPEAKFCSHCGHAFKGEPTTVLGSPHTAPAVGAASSVVPEEGYAASSGLLSAETMLQDRYRITQLLGQGGMGAVYLATDTRFASRTCVIKEMLDHFNDPEQRAQATESFHREADFLSSLKHPGIPEVYDRFTEANRHYLVMEYINGPDLEQRLLDNGGPFGEREVINWSIQCCDVLSYLHHQNPPIIYRDMKPANVLTTTWGKVYLVDFGIARFFNPVSRGTMIGTQGYAPPEQYRGQVEPRSDLYALGATMHYLLTGRDPQNEPPFSFPPVKSLNPDISDEMEMMILKALDPEVENRFLSADEMLGQLMSLGGDASEVVRECPHCGEKSSITRQFCPHCKQYISKKAHVLKGNGSGQLVTDAAGKHQNKPTTPTAKLEAGPQSATATHLAMPTGRTEFELVSLKPLILGLGAAALVVAVAIGGIKLLGNQAPQAVSMGEAVVAVAQPAKAAGVSAYRAGDFERAIKEFTKAVTTDPADGEARIYLQNAHLKLSGVPTFTLAVAGPFTGDYQAKGAAELQGAAFAQERINGTEASPKLMLMLANDGSNPDSAIDVARALADDPEIMGVIGHLDSANSWAAMPMYNLAGLPVISPTSTSTQLAGLSPNFFRLSPDDALTGAALARHVTGPMAAKKIAVLAPQSNPHSQGLANAFTAEAERAGATLERITYAAGGDWNALAGQIKTQAPEVIFLAGSHTDAVGLAKAKAAAGIATPIVGADSLYLPELISEGGGAVEGLICATTYHPRLDAPMARRFETDFQGKLGQEANSRAALTYEAVELFAAAAQKVGPSREALATYLKTLGKQGFDGLSGHAGLDAAGNVRRPLYLMKVEGGRFVPQSQVAL